MPLVSTEESLMLGQTGNLQAKSNITTVEQSKEFSKTANIFTTNFDSSLPLKVQTKCKSLVQNKFNNKRSTQPFLL